MATLQNNLIDARAACNHVLGLGIEAANWDYYNLRTQAESWEACDRLKNAHNANRENGLKMLPSACDHKLNRLDRRLYGPSGTTIPSARTAQKRLYANRNREQRFSPDVPYRSDAAQQTSVLAEVTQVYGSGNCGETASIAVRYLEEKTAARPIDMINYKLGDSAWGGQDDHTVVVIGRPAGADLLKPETWGAHVVICDPWAQGLQGEAPFGVYIAARLRDRFSQMFKKTTLTSPQLKDRIE